MRRIPIFFLSIIILSSFHGRSGRLTEGDQLLKQYCTFGDSSAVYSEQILGSLIPAGLFDNARIIGCGESSHGSHQNQELKKSLFRFLVNRFNVRIFVLEANYAQVELVNEFVRGKNIDEDTLMSGLSFWVWQTKEMRDLIDWIRDYNRGKADTDCISFLGMDVQDIRAASTRVSEFFDAYGKKYSVQARSLLQPFMTDSFYRRTPLDSETIIHRLYNLNCLHALADSVDPLIAKQDDQNFLIAKRNIEVLKGSFCASVSSRAYVLRDSLMAANVKWIYDNIARGKKIFVSAHNEHVGIRRYNFMKRFPFESMGAWLRDDLGSAYVSIGVDFISGSFNAYTLKEKITPGRLVALTRGKITWDTLMPCDISGIDAHTLIGHVNKFNKWLTWINIDNAKNDSALMKSRLVTKGCIIHGVGAGFTSERWIWENMDFANEFDQMMIFRHSSPTLLLRRSE